MPTRKILPIGSQDFEGMIKGHYVYVDKTAYLYHLLLPGIQKGAAGPKYFFSRPRRFGKSLTLSTLDAIFSGKKELFTGLYIAEKTDYDFPLFPVLRFDFSRISHGSGEEFSTVLTRQIQQYATQYGSPLFTAATPADAWDQLLSFFKTQNQKIVILIDEYDKPILDHITNVTVAKENRDVLKSFYEVIKANDDVLRFVFITGITKFSQMNIFSGMNNLEDISLQSEFAALCGYTQAELESYFAAYIADFAQAATTDIASLLKKIRHWYNGFRFTRSPLTVYNPFSTLTLLKTQDFQYHWFATGTPTYLMSLIRHHKIDIREIAPAVIRSTHTASYQIETLAVNFPALLFQTGYLTIVGVEEDLLTLDFPNLEVREAFYDALLSDMSEIGDDFSGVSILQLRTALTQDSLEDVFRILTLFFSKIPYDIQEPTEKYYQSLFFLIFVLIGTRIRAEVRTNVGRIDAIVETASHLYIFEFKINGTAQEALDQIETKDYAFSFQDSEKIIQKIGVSFSVAERNIVEWVIPVPKYNPR